MNSRTITRVTAESSNKKGSTLEISELGEYELVAKFRDVCVSGVKGITDVVVYIINSRIVLHIESRDGEKHRDDCILVDGHDIVITRGMSQKAAHLRNWTNPEESKYEPAEIKEEATA